MQQSPIAIRNKKLGRTVCEALKKHGFDAFWCATKEDACKKAMELIQEGSSVSWGGCASAEECGILDSLRQGSYTLIDRDTAKNPEERADLMRRAFFADWYLAGTNALSEDGQLVNVDGNGNRVAAMAYGPKNVLVVAGVNKIVKTAEDALVRARTVASPINAQRFGLKTPCSVTGACSNCDSPDCICNIIVTTRHSKPAGRIKVLLVGEFLGF
ncbi:MAG: lactate utilization protein [Hydrogeniiclostridium sp.]